MILILFNIKSSTFYKKNTKEARWNLIVDLEDRLLSSNKDFISSFEKIKIELNKIGNDINSMRESCDQMEKKLQETKEIIQDVHVRSKELIMKENINQIRMIVIDKYMSSLQNQIL